MLADVLPGISGYVKLLVALLGLLALIGSAMVYLRSTNAKDSLHLARQNVDLLQERVAILEAEQVRRDADHRERIAHLEGKVTALESTNASLIGELATKLVAAVRDELARVAPRTSARRR